MIRAPLRRLPWIWLAALLLALCLLAIAFWSLRGSPTSGNSDTGLTTSTHSDAGTLASAFLTAIQNEDAQALLSITTGYENLAEILRDAALTDPDVLARDDLGPRHKLTVLALRDRFDAQQIRNLSAQEIIQVHPNPGQSALALPPGTPATLHDVQLTDAKSAHMSMYLGTQFQTLPLRQVGGTWRVDATQFFSPTQLHPIDVDLMNRVAIRGGRAAAWLTLYASLSGRSVDNGLLQLP